MNKTKPRGTRAESLNKVREKLGLKPKKAVKKATASQPRKGRGTEILGSKGEVIRHDGLGDATEFAGQKIAALWHKPISKRKLRHRIQSAKNYRRAGAESTQAGL